MAAVNLQELTGRRILRQQQIKNRQPSQHWDHQLPGPRNRQWGHATLISRLHRQLIPKFSRPDLLATPPHRSSLPFLIRRI